MLPYFTEYYGNAASNHSFGVKSSNSTRIACEHLADLLVCDPSDIIFTSGATEAINLGLKGFANAYKDKGNHIITCATEPPAVLDTCEFLESNGFKITYLLPGLNIEEFESTMVMD